MESLGTRGVETTKMTGSSVADGAMHDNCNPEVGVINQDVLKESYGKGQGKSCKRKIDFWQTEKSTHWFLQQEIAKNCEVTSELAVSGFFFMVTQ